MKKVSYAKRLLLAVLMGIAVMPAMAIDYWTIGKIQAVLVGGEETSEAGSVFVSAEQVASADEIIGQPSTMQTDPVMLTGSAGSSAVNKEYYFYAKANEGYKFLGFASSSTGEPSGAGAAENLSLVGDYYTYSSKAGAGWSGNTEETAKMLIRYAVYEKIGGGDNPDVNPGEGGDDDATIVKVVSITNQYNQNLIGTTLVVNKGETFDAGDMVTHIYVTYDHELATTIGSKNIANSVEIINTTTGVKINLNQYSCGLMNDKHKLDLFLSGDSYINNEDYQGVYSVKIPAGIASTATGIETEAYEFSFTYGNPDDVEPEEEVNLDDFVGNYITSGAAEGEIVNILAFQFEKVGEGYFITNMDGTATEIPLVKVDNGYAFANTTGDNYSFVSDSGDSVNAVFGVHKNTISISMEGFTFTVNGKEPIVGGMCYYVTNTDTGINAAVNESKSNVVYDMLGRKKMNATKGINIINGKKYLAK